MTRVEQVWCRLEPGSALDEFAIAQCAMGGMPIVGFGGCAVATCAPGGVVSGMWHDGDTAPCFRRPSPRERRRVTTCAGALYFGATGRLLSKRKRDDGAATSTLKPPKCP